MTMTREEMNAALGLTEGEMDAIAEEYENDAWPEGSFGKPMPGRPTMFAEAMGTVSFKEERPKIQLINARAASLGLSRSDYLRRLVDQDLAAYAS